MPIYVNLWRDSAASEEIAQIIQKKSATKRNLQVAVRLKIIWKHDAS